MQEENIGWNKTKLTSVQKVHPTHHGGNSWTWQQRTCAAYKGVQDRIQPGAEIFKVDMEKKETDSYEELDNHCHESCKNYQEACMNPKKCELRRRNNKEFPIKEALNDHLCGFMGMIKEKDMKLINSGREEDQKMSLMGFLNDGYIKAREARYAALSSCSPVMYSKVKEDTPMEGWDESIQDNREGGNAWDFVCSDMDGSVFTEEQNKSEDTD